MRLVLSGSQRPAASDLQDSPRRLAARSTDHGSANEELSGAQGSGHRRFLELSRQQEDSPVHAEAERRMENGSARSRSGAGISQVHRMFSLPERLPRTARS